MLNQLFQIINLTFLLKYFLFYLNGLNTISNQHPVIVCKII